MHLPPAPNHLLHLPSCRHQGARSIVHSIHDNPDTSFRCRSVWHWSSIITDCQKHPENYTSFALLLWIMHQSHVCRPVWSHQLDLSRGTLMDVSPLLPDSVIIDYCDARGHAGRCVLESCVLCRCAAPTRTTLIHPQERCGHIWRAILQIVLLTFSYIAAGCWAIDSVSKLFTHLTGQH